MTENDHKTQGAGVECDSCALCNINHVLIQIPVSWRAVLSTLWYKRCASSFRAIPRGENGRPEKKRERERHDDPADDMRAGKRSCLSGIAADFSFGAKEKKRLS